MATCLQFVLLRAAGLTAGFLLSLAVPAYAQSGASSEEHLQVAISANQRRVDPVPSSSQQTRARTGFSVELARVRPRAVSWVADVSVARGTTRIDEGPSATLSHGTRDVRFVDITGGVRVTGGRRVRPFVDLFSGISIGRVSYTGDVLSHTRSAIGEEGTTFVVKPGAGVDGFISSRVGVRAQVTGLIMNTPTTVKWPLQFNLGLVFTR